MTRKLGKIKKKNFWKQHFLYPTLFKENYYGIAYNRFVDDGKLERNKIYELNNYFNFVTLKRLIKKLRRSNYSWIDPHQFVGKFHIVQKILIIIFDFIFPMESESVMRKKNEWSSNQSLHSIFSFMENQFDSGTICLDITIPYCFHPEILTRLFRTHISDTSFLHFLRLLLHNEGNITFLPRNEFFNLLWNFQIHKFESSLINIWKHIYDFTSAPFWFPIDRTNFIQKIEYVANSKRLDGELIDKILEKDYSIHYARYQNTLIVNTNGNFYLFVKNWNLFLSIFWEKYFHLWFEPSRIDIKDLSRNHLDFLGYLSHIENRSRLTRIELINNLIDTDLITKEFCTIIPVVESIRSLTREKFCSTSGRPICKISWTTLTDYEIFRRFDQIIRSIFSYYGGSIKKKGLYQLHYILRFSCAKTLACKHKSTIRIVWRKYGSNFFEKSIYLKKPQSILWRIYEKKFWYLDIIRINHLAHSSQKLKNVGNF